MEWQSINNILHDENVRTAYAIYLLFDNGRIDELYLSGSGFPFMLANGDDVDLINSEGDKVFFICAGPDEDDTITATHYLLRDRPMITLPVDDAKQGAAAEIESASANEELPF